MSNVSNSSSSSTPRRGLFSKMFQKPVSTQNHPYPHSSTSARDSGITFEPDDGSSTLTLIPDSTLVSQPSQSSPRKDGQRDPNAVFGTLSSTYGWGGVHVPALPSDGKSKKSKPTAAQQDAAAPAPSAPHQPLRRPLTQAQREQAIVDLSSRYGHTSLMPGGRWGK